MDFTRNEAPFFLEGGCDISSGASAGFAVFALQNGMSQRRHRHREVPAEPEQYPGLRRCLIAVRA
jgi:hypothetical protein